jgi:hypothetical protein
MNSPDIDMFEWEYSQFQWDVHILIEGTLEASIRYLDTEAKTELEKIEEAMKKPFDDEYQEHLVDEHVDVLATNSGQERFLRNMALVALASRLAHALREMARTAELFSKRREGRYGSRNDSEFERLWAEYFERFGSDVKNSGRAAFVKSMVEVRNQIVHAGGEANVWKPLDKIDWNTGEEGYLRTDFSKQYPEYVSGTGMSAEVSVSEELLDKNIKASIELVGWLAEELRRKELESMKSKSGIP